MKMNSWAGITGKPEEYLFLFKVWQDWWLRFMFFKDIQESLYKCDGRHAALTKGAKGSLFYEFMLNIYIYIYFKENFILLSKIYFRTD